MGSSANRLYGLGWALFGALVLAASWRMDRLESLHINPWSAPGLMPGVLGALMTLFGVALALRPAVQGAPGAPDAASGISVRRIGLALVLCFAFAAGVLGRGWPFWLTSFAFLFVAILVFRILDGDRASPRLAASSAAIALGAALAISLVFERVFLVRLP